ncbi:MAG TPA: GH32 C-terminal domain-containing protein, partial [Opitutaceae bacterium]|nr:GH32 C-terminal domain-containing protein [Opitutaceae bacterium]
LHIFLDHSTLEVFADDGRAVISDQIFAPEGYGGITMYSVGASARLNSLQAWHLSSIWRDTADVPSELSSSLTGRQ